MGWGKEGFLWCKKFDYIIGYTENKRGYRKYKVLEDIGLRVRSSRKVIFGLKKIRRDVSMIGFFFCEG